MRANEVKRKLQAGQPAIGAAAGTTSPWAAGMLSQAGYDWVLIDTQHGIWSPDGWRNAVIAISQGKAAAVARVAFNDYHLIGRLLDDGMLGIIVPLVNTREDAEAAAYAFRYPPRGGRSLAGTPLTALYGPDYADSADDEVFLAVQIESAQAVENAEEILSVDGIDACWVGPADLALSMGLKVSDIGVAKAHNEAVARVLEACRKTGKAPGYACNSLEMGKRRIAEGFRFVNIGGDAIFIAESSKWYLQQLRS